MSVAVPAHRRSSIGEIRFLCGVLAAVVLIDAVVVRAPGLGLLAVPFVMGATAYRRGGMVASSTLALFAMLLAAAGANYAVQNGFDAGWGDLLFAYVGTPVAALVVVMTVMRVIGRRGRH